MTSLTDNTVFTQFRQCPTASARAPIEEAVADLDRAGARSLYIHIPFCSHKCHYCDFYSFVDSRDRQGIFAHRLEAEFGAIAKAAGPIETIFIGGGTPSLLEIRHWKSLLDSLATNFDLSPILTGSGEFTVECNPESVSAELMQTLREGGVNRISMGAQSFDAKHLQTLERLHNPDRVPLAIQHAKNAGIERVSLDLIYAIPGQTLAELSHDLDTALSLPIEHLSCYELTYEPNTAMTRRLERGDFSRCPEELEIQMFELVGAKAQAAGLMRYEVSNYAKPGAECLHNLAYWRQESWLAAGPSASAFIAGHRFKNIPRLESYITGDDEGYSFIVDHEQPDAVRLVQEKIMTGLRLSDGIDGDGLTRELEKLDTAAADRLVTESIVYENLGQLDRSDGVWKLTDSGLLFADGIAGSLMVAIS